MYFEGDAQASAWDSERTVVFHDQILNSELFHAVTGNSPPESPISAKTYTQHGLPFYKFYEENSSVKGEFGNIKSVKEIDALKDKSGMGKNEHEQSDEQTHNNLIIMLNPEGFPVKFRSVSQLDSELSRLNFTKF